jgi:Formylmethanofuran dehydrogenase subunit C
MKKIKAQSIILLVILLAGLVCLTGMASAAPPSPATDISAPVASGMYSISTNGNYTVTNVIGGTGRIVVEEDITATIYLDNVSLTNTLSPLQLKKGASVTLILADGSTNTFTCTGVSVASNQPQAGIHVPSGTIETGLPTVGTTSLTIKEETDDTGKLIALGGAFSAGIGGGPNQAFGNITIEGGNVTAETRKLSTVFSGNAAGIGGGGGNTAGISISVYSNKITIFGNSTVIATSVGNGSGIGGGSSTNGIGSSGETIEIYGNADVTATSKGSGAGIGGGFSNNNTSGAGGNILIYGNANVTAISERNGAGIGGGGSENTGTGGAGGNINIYGNANVTTSSGMDGAGIGGGGAATGVAGAGGIINIYGNANVTTFSDRNGAGTGGGGADTGVAGAGGIINIYGDAIVSSTVNAAGKGAGIGGGGFASSPGTAGASGSINIYGRPIITAEAASSNDIGSGNSGTVGTITIIGGNVNASETIAAKNSNIHGGNNLGKIEIVILDQNNLPLPGEQLSYTAIGSIAPYEYTATTDEDGKAYIWLPFGNQLIIVREDGTNRELGRETMVLTLTSLTTIPFPTIPNYSPLLTEVEQDITWANSGDSLTPVIYLYERSMGTLELVPYDAVTLAPISIATSHIVAPVANLYYDYSADANALELTLDTEYPGRYVLAPQGSTIIYIDGSMQNTVNVYFTPQPRAPGSSGGSGHGSATIVDNNAANNNTSGSNNTTPTRLTILCVDENGNELFIQSLTTIVGSSEAINAPPLKGYELLTSQTSQNIRMETGENTITFRYAPTDDQQPSGEDRQNSSRWSLPWYIFVPIFIIGIAASFLIGQKIQKNK